MQTANRYPDNAGNGHLRQEVLAGSLAVPRSPDGTLSEVAHDARNMVTALGLYCDMLEEPGVLAIPFAHYGQELRIVAAASRRLVEKLTYLDAYPQADHDAYLVPLSDRHLAALPKISASRAHAPIGSPNRASSPGRTGSLSGEPYFDPLPPLPIANLAAEIAANRNILSALAGPAISVTVDIAGGALPVRLSGEDLTRVLVNLVKNAAEAMPDGGRINIELRECAAELGESGFASGSTTCLTLAIEDSGLGIPEELEKRIFDSGYTTRGKNSSVNPSPGSSSNNAWPFCHRGVGLAITRSIVEASGGSIRAVSRPSGTRIKGGARTEGARIEIELPVRGDSSTLAACSR